MSDDTKALAEAWKLIRKLQEEREELRRRVKDLEELNDRNIGCPVIAQKQP